MTTLYERNDRTIYFSVERCGSKFCIIRQAESTSSKLETTNLIAGCAYDCKYALTYEEAVEICDEWFDTTMAAADSLLASGWLDHVKEDDDNDNL